MSDNPEHQDNIDGITRREFCVAGAAVVGAVGVSVYVPPVLRAVVLPSAYAKAAPANKESCEKDPAADKDPGEKPPDDKDPLEKDPNEKSQDKDPFQEKDEEGQTSHNISPLAFANLKDEWS